ncbi:MAG: penicillin-binding protein 2 [Rhodobacteraceae bacterium]|nr:penicillin-binding protein 2 [Paracoccaceae bacterium]
MKRIALRPLPRILSARDRGESTAAIERENLRARNDALRERSRMQAESRLLVLGLAFVLLFATVGLRMGTVALADGTEPRASFVPGPAISALRADITDRNGALLATNLVTNAIFAHPPQMIDPERTARELVAIFPDLDEARLLRDFTGDRRFVWLKRRLSPEQVQAVHDIGEPGIAFGAREMRLYPNGRLASHVLGGTRFGTEGVSSAEVIGVAGVELALDEALRDPARMGAPVALSLDLPVQGVVTQVLEGGMRLMNAAGAAAVLMDARTGEIRALVSLPDFDPNDRPRPATTGDPSQSPLFNRAVQGLYELGSTLKTFPIAQALDEGLVRPDSMVNTQTPMQWGRFTIRDFRSLGREASVTDVFARSSNVGTARLALELGAGRQQAFLSDLGLFQPLPLELAEAARARPLLPQRWSEISTITVSYGHGLSISPVHLATAYAAMVNGGTMVTPTLLSRETPPAPGRRVISPATSVQINEMMRRTVTDGTASFAEVPFYSVGAKTGTADKVNPAGGYFRERVIATIATSFPAHDPDYVLVVMLDEPVETSGTEPRRTAGWTAAPVAGEIIRRIAPLLGIEPEIARSSVSALSQRSH